MFVVLLIVFAIAGLGYWASILLLVQQLKKCHSDALRQLGIRDAWDLLVNIPPYWPEQWRFVVFLCSGGLRELNDARVTRLVAAAFAALTILIGSLIGGFAFVARN
ncbi:MAG: hypothetical protein EXS05_05515 [Planctomycetaceae bacterium]|nr:hypothetical protein [Planctomycetaceae bacterium]